MPTCGRRAVDGPYVPVRARPCVRGRGVVNDGLCKMDGVAALLKWNNTTAMDGPVGLPYIHFFGSENNFPDPSM